MNARYALCLTLLLGWACLTSPPVEAADDGSTLGWSWDQVTVRPNPAGATELKVLGATLLPGQPGEPALPAATVRLKAPEGSRVGSFRLVGTVTSERPLAAPLAAIPQDAPSTAGGPVAVEPLVSAYEAPVFPDERVRFLGITFGRGVAWANFAVYPLTVEEGQTLHLLEQGMLEVEWEADATVGRPFKSLRGSANEGFLNRPVNPLATEIRAKAITDMPSLESDPVDYLIITSAALETSVQPLVRWKNGIGTPTTVRTVEWILENYTYGSDSQERIRNFVSEAYRYWGTKWVLIVGGPESVPIRTIRSSAWNNPTGVDIITDLYYVCLDGTWNADGDEYFGESRRNFEPINPGDEVDFDPELHIGRIPAISPSQFAIWLAKYMKYVEDPVRDGYLDKILLLGEVLFDACWTRGELPTCGKRSINCPPDLCNCCASLDGAQDCVDVVEVMDAAPDISFEYVELYEWFEYWRDNGRPSCILEDKASVVSRLNEGMGIVHHVGHGDRDRMSIGTQNGLDGSGRYLVADADQLSNGDRVGVVYSINCNSAAIDFDCLGEAMVFAENGGMVAYVGSTNLDFPTAARRYMESFYTKVFHREVTTVGEAYYETIAAQMAGEGETESYKRFLAYSLILIGDPQMSIWLGTPETLGVESATAIRLGTTSLSVEVRSGSPSVTIEGATVCAFKDGDVFAVGITDASGTVDLPFRPSTQGTYRIAATHPEYAPHIENPIRSVTAPTDAGAVSVTALSINDSGGSDTEGDNNGRFELGETVRVNATLRNDGDVAVSDISLTLSLEPYSQWISYVDLLDVAESGITVNADRTLQVAGAFRLRVRPTPPPPDDLYENGDRLPILAKVTLSQNGHNEEFLIPLPAYRPILSIESTDLVEVGGVDDPDGEPDTGETILWTPKIRNAGSGSVGNLIGYLTAESGAIIETGTVVIEDGDLGDLVSSVEPFEFEVTDVLSLDLRFTIRSVNNSEFVFFDRSVEFIRPLAPEFPESEPPIATKNAVVLNWDESESPDVQGYVLERSLTESEGYEIVSSRLITRLQYFRDESVIGLTRYYYRVAAVDSSGNQSEYSIPVSATTTPGVLAGWPLTVLGQMTFGCPTIESIDESGDYEVFTTAEFLYGMKPDGSEIVDGDQVSSTRGIFSTNGSAFWSKPAVGDLDGDGVPEIVATSRYLTGTAGTGQVLVWDPDGNLLWSVTPGTATPSAASTFLLASPAIGDIDDDPEFEVVTQLKAAIYAWNHDGTPVAGALSDGMLLYVGGDHADDATRWPLAYGSPALADVDGDLKDEIILGVESNFSPPRSRLVVVDGDGTLLSALDLETPSGGDLSAANSSASLADIDSDGDYEIFVATRNYLWGSTFNKSTGNLERIAEWQTGGRTPIAKLPTNWIEPTPAIGDINGDGILDVVVGAGQGKLVAVHGLAGTFLARFPYEITASSNKVGSPILVQLDDDPAAEIVVGDNTGYIYALDPQTGKQIAGFPYIFAGRAQHGLTLWDIDRDSHPNLIIAADQNPEVTVLDITNVDWPETLEEVMLRNPWTSFRHDARNTGTLNKKVITPVIAIDLFTSTETGAAILEWDVSIEPHRFEVWRQSIDGIWRSRFEGSADLFRNDVGGYLFRDETDPGRYLYQITGHDAAGQEIYRSGEVAVSIDPFLFRLVGVAPNPFNPRTSIRVETPGGPLSLEIVDLGGRKVRTLAGGSLNPGIHDLVWDGRDDQGHEVGSGVYLARLKGVKGRASEKLVLLR